MNWNPPPLTVHGRLRLILTVVGILAALLVVSSLRASTTPSYSVPSTIANNCSTDVTSQLLSWIGSVPNNSTLTFTAGACYKIEGTLEIRGRSGLTIDGNGATFRSFDAPDDQRSIWRVIDSSNFAFVNMTLRGSYTNGGVHDVSLQHAHGIDLRGVSAEIANVTASDLAGDCFYFGLGYSSALTRSSGSVHDSTCSRIGRNAVSVTAGDDIRIEHVTTDQIGFVAFDIEPNTQPGFGSRRVVVTNNTIGSYYLYAWAIVDNGPIADQSFTDNRITAPKGLRIAAVSFDASQPTGVTVTGNVATAATWSGAMEIQDVSQLVVTGNTVPMSGGTMATVDSSCTVNVSSNSYPGGTKEVQLTNTPTSCVVPTPAPTPAPAPAPAPSIASFSPSSGPVGTKVTVSGSSFTGATKVSFNGLAASFTVDSGSQLTATVPTGATSGSISVVTPAGTGTSSSSFTVAAPTPAPLPPPPAPAPGVGSFLPSSGPVGTKVTVSGSSFTGATKVSFNGLAASFTVDSGSQLTATVPTGATSGSISVVTPAGTGTSSSSFTVAAPTPAPLPPPPAPAPGVGSFLPSSGPVGTKVTVSGSSFTGATKVSFNGLAASFTVDSGSQLTATVPTGATSGSISVVTPAGTGTSSSSFTVAAPTPAPLPPPPAPAPGVVSFLPSSGPVGTKVTVSGSSFTGATKVSFNGLAASFTVDSGSQLTATVPTGATSGSISVVTPAGTGTSSSSFTVSAPAAARTPAPSIASFSPSSGPVGTKVTVNGAAFTGATKVSFNGLTASFTVNSATLITVTVPAGAGKAKITVKTAEGTATSAKSFQTTKSASPKASLAAMSSRRAPLVRHALPGAIWPYLAVWYLSALER